MRLLLLILLIHLPAASQALSPREEAFLQVGIEVFPTIINSISTQEIHQQTIYLIHTPCSKPLANLAATQISQKLGQEAIVITPEKFFADPRVGVVFITSPYLQTQELKEYTDQNKLLVFSPFIGAAKSYSDIGVLITDRVKPTLNIRQAQNKQIKFKQFFYKVAKTYAAQ